MLRELLAYLAPFKVIADELSKIRQLYEAELAQRENPVYLVTEKPRESDTEVTYMGDEEEKPKVGFGWWNQ
jgi:hypothetical protein